MADGSLIFDSKIDSKGFNSGVNSISSGLKGLTSSFVKLGAVIGVAFSVKAVIDFGKQAIQTASDIQEVQNVVDTAFGSMSNKMEEFAETSIEQFGISKLAAKQTGSTFMAMSTGMGIAQDSASDMAIALTGLSADMASFYNKEQDVTATALKSVFTGETETLKQFGIVMTEANLKAFAMSQGINKNISDMTQAEKVQLRYQYVMQQTSLAQGDFAKTSDSWANQTRILSENWKEFSGTVGNIFVQVLTPAIQGLNSLLKSLSDYATSAYNALAELFGWQTNNAKATQQTASAISDSVDNQNALTEATENTKKANDKTLASFDRLNKLSDNSDKSKSNTSNSGISAKTTGAQSVIESGSTKNVKSMDKAMKSFISTLKKFKVALKPIENFSSKAMNDFYKNCLKPIGKWVIGEGLPRFAQITKEMINNIDWNKLNLSLNNLWYSIAPFATQIGNGLLWFYENVLCPLATWSISELLPTFLNLLATAIETLNTIITAAQPVLLWLWDNILVPFASWTGGVIISVIEGLTEKLRAFSEWAKNNQSDMNLITSIVLGFFAGIIFYHSTKKIISVVKSIKTAFEKFGSLVGTAGFKIAFAAAAFGILAAGIIYLASNWNKMSGAQKAITILGGLAAAATAAAIAIAIFHTAWSVGVAAAAIAGGLALLGLTFAFTKGSGSTIDNAYNQANDFYSSNNFSGGGSWDFPKLATGTVVPANYGEFLATLGDNKREPEIVSPLSTMKQALAEALAENGGSGTGTINLNVILDGNKIYSTVVKLNKANTRRTGINALA